MTFPFSLSSLFKKPALTLDAFQQALAVAEKVVMAVEQAHGGLPGADKKALAEAVLGEILSHLGLRVPKVVIDAAIESAVLLLNAVLQGQEPAPAAAAPGAGKAAV
jgi:hypothetical protein